MREYYLKILLGSDQFSSLRRHFFYKWSNFQRKKTLFDCFENEEMRIHKFSICKSVIFLNFQLLSNIVIFSEVEDELKDVAGAMVTIFCVIPAMIGSIIGYIFVCII